MAFALGPHAQSRSYRCLSFNEIGSTNAEAMERARAGDRGPLWLVTDRQTQGRGRRFRPWVTTQGNLAASVVETMNVPPPVAATLGFAAGLALEAALRSLSPQNVIVDFRLKWPNDVLANGRKLAGILLEAEPALIGGGLTVVVGIGVNVNSSPEGLPYPATSLLSEGINVTAPQLFASLSDSWATFRDLWDEGRGLREIRRQWLDRAAGLGEEITIRIGDSAMAGIFRTIDEEGRLILESGGRLVPVAAGDVYFGSVASAGAQ